MQTKLTLRLEEDLIVKAKKLAQQRGKSLSKLVAEFFSYITSKDMPDPSEPPPIVKSMVGILADSKIEESAYKEYLEKKHL